MLTAQNSRLTPITITTSDLFGMSLQALHFGVETMRRAERTNNLCSSFVTLRDSRQGHNSNIQILERKGYFILYLDHTLVFKKIFAMVWIYSLRILHDSLHQRFYNLTAPILQPLTASDIQRSCPLVKIWVNNKLIFDKTLHIIFYF